MKKHISLFLAVLLVLGMLPTVASAAPAANDGVYQIGTAEELLWFAETVNGGGNGIDAVLTADIDLTGTDWPGIGNYSNRFAGSFDGQGHTVTFKDAGWGLFGYVKGIEGSLATIENVRTAGTIKYSGIAHNAAYASFTNCINGATITATSSNVAGIVGTVSGVTSAGITKSDVTITNCGNEASITGVDYIAGIVGYTQTNTRLNGCYNTGNIHGTENIGGLVGFMQQWTGTCEVRNSYNTGRVTGSNYIGGIIGHMYNGVSAINCYNAGNCTYAITGGMYNNTAKVTNCYFQGSKSTKSVPDFTSGSVEVTARAAAKSASEMSSAEFAALLGTAFQQSCPTPVLSWQTAAGHSDSPCNICGYGSTVKEQYDVSFPSHAGYTLSGEAKATQGGSYSFTLAINSGYEKNDSFAVKVNGTAVTAASDGSYTVLNVSGPLSVTVFGVQVIPGSYAVKLPAQGYGYRISGDATVDRDADYTFTVSFVDGFAAGDDFSVMANGTQLSPVNGVYTIKQVRADQEITVSGVDVVSKGITAAVEFSITQGHNEFHVAPNSEEIMLDQTITVPYFDLSLYGLERYYYNPYCYVDEAGNIRGVQQKGTPESAYDHVTVMHAFIVATELFYFGYDQAQVGKGTSYKANPTAFDNAISWTQNAGSSFMDFWDHGTNLNYYVNYEYPLAYTGWGATSDQVLIENGDVLSVHMITGNASGSRFGFFSVNDADKKYTAADTVDTYQVDQGEKIDLTLYWTSTTSNYATGYELMENQTLYWISADDAEADVQDWNRTDFGGTAAAKLVTDSEGTVTISTVGLEPGTYYIAALGGWTEGGAVDNSGFQSAGGETGPAVFKLVVNEYEGKVGDVNGDTQITGADAALIQQYVAKLTTAINEGIADVNGDGSVTGADAALIQQYVAKLITDFPTDN